MSVILDFITMLRYFGLPVSPDETITAQKAYQIVGIENKNTLKIGLKVSIVKRREDLHIFDECFDSFFNYHPTSIYKSKSTLIHDLGAKRFLDRLENSINDLGYRVGELLVKGQVDKAITVTKERIMQGNGFSSGQTMMNEIENINKSFQRSFRFAFGIPVPIRGLSPSQRQNLSSSALRLATFLNMFEQGIKRGSSENFDISKNSFDINEQRNPENISDKESFLYQDLNRVSLTIANVKEQLIEIGRILASRERRRRERAKKGKLDFRRTFRKNLMNAGVPLDLIQKHKRISDPELIILNDVSRSTRWVADWFFIVTYASRSVFRKIRIFEFDNTMVEVTEALNRKTISRALEERFRCWEKPIRKRRIHSDYQTSLEDFFHLIQYHPLTRRTSVLILGDCRDNEGMWTSNNPISSDLIRKIAIAAKRVVVLNPEEKSLWNTGDSVVSYYRNAGAEIFHVTNLRDLIGLVFAL